MSLKVKYIIENHFIYIYILGTSTILHSIFIYTHTYIYIYRFYDTLVSHNMHSLCNLKVKYSFVFIIYLSKLIKKLFIHKFWLSRASHGHNTSYHYKIKLHFFYEKIKFHLFCYKIFSIVYFVIKSWLFF